MKHTVWGKFPFDNDLIVSIDGEVIRRATGKQYSTYKDQKGYHLIAFKTALYGYTNKKQRLVAMTFLPNPECKPEVNHKDCNKNNNSMENFEWVTTLENVQHAIANGAREACSVAGWNKASSDLTAKIKELGSKIPRLSNRAIGRQLGIDKGTVGKYR